MSATRPRPITRRRALTSATTVGVGLPLLAACGDEGAGPTATDPSSSAPASPPTPSATSPSSASSPSSAATSQAASGVVSTADVPVGGGVVLPDQRVVVTQPSDGDIKVFDYVCTHQGCPVSEVTDVIVCPCHASHFDISTGEPVTGPASAPLAAVGFTVEGDQVVLS